MLGILGHKGWLNIWLRCDRRHFESLFGAVALVANQKRFHYAQSIFNPLLFHCTLSMAVFSCGSGIFFPSLHRER